MRWLFGLLIVLALGASALFGVGYYVLPPTSEVARSVDIPRPASILYPLLTNLRTFNEFSPWFERDPKADYQFDGPEEGVGQSARWSSSVSDLGDGVLTIVKTLDDKEVDTRLERSAGPIPFIAPADMISKFTLTPIGENGSANTRVTWSTKSQCSPQPEAVPCRYMAFISHLQLSGQFELGLAKLKTIAGKLPALDITDLKLERVAVAAKDFAYFESDVPQGAEEFRAVLRQAFTTVDGFFKQNSVAPAAPPMAVTVKNADGKLALRAGRPFAGPAPLVPSGVKVGKTPYGPALKVLYTGPYSGMTPTYAKLDAYVKAHRLAPVGYPWEVYLDDPDTTPAEQLRTEIYFPYQ